MRVRVAGIIVVSVLLLAAVAYALPKDAATFKTLYNPKAGSKVATAGCLLCHSQAPFNKTNLNPYGKDLAKQPVPRTAASFKAIEKLDSDKDGVTNLKEIQAGTLPGDPTSK